MRPFQDVLIDLGARLKLPGLTSADGSARYPGGYPDVAPLFLTLLAALLGDPIATLAGVLAALSVAAGVVAERWLFFAEARYTVTFYYGASAV